MRKIIDDYLKERRITFNVGKHLPLETRRVETGSILGPLLWNLGYDPFLRAAVPNGAEIFVYADNTLVIVGGSTWTRTLRIMEVVVAES